MVIVDPNTLKIIYNVRSTLSVTGNNRDEAAFQQMLLNFAPYADYNPIVTAEYFGSNGATVPDSSTAIKIKYSVSMSLYRPTTYTSPTTDYKFTYDLSKAENTVTPTALPVVTQTSVNARSDPLGGTYTLTIDGKTISFSLNGAPTSDIPFNTPPATLASYFANSLTP